MFSSYPTECIGSGVYKKDGYTLRYVKEQCTDLCRIAVQTHLGIIQRGFKNEFWLSETFRYIVDQTPELCLLVIKGDADCISSIRNQTREICLEAVRRKGRSLRYIVEKTPEICLEAVKQNGNALQFVQNQTPEIYTTAIRTNPNILSYINQTIFYDGKVYKSFYYEQECNVYSKPLEERKLAWNSLQMLNRYLPSLPDDCMKRICLEIS